MSKSGGQYQGSKKRLAKNTVLLYFRQILILAVTLYTSRVVLQVLGASDYGIYSLIGSFVSLFNVISGAFVVAITRYMAFVMGEGNVDDMKNLYSTSVWIQLILGGGITIAVIISGIWYINNLMVLPVARIDATTWVLVFSAASFYIGLLSVPYNALIVAHERMQAFAYIAFVEVSLKLVTVLILPWTPFDKLITYGALTVFVTFIVRLLYMWYCQRHFAECMFKWHIDWSLFKDMMKFIRWAFLGNGAVTLKEQGISIIMNLFLGTTINAARGLANSVNGAVTSFINNFIQAVQPQITKMYSSGQHEAMCHLICLSCRFSFFLLLFLSLPVIKNIDYILSIWLGETPEYTNIFIVLTLIDSLVNSLSAPMLYGTLAEGNIKVYEIVLTITYVASLPISYLLLWLEISPVWIYVMLIIMRMMIQSYLVWQGKAYGMSFSLFGREVLWYVLPVALVATLVGCVVDLSGLINMQMLCFIAETTVLLMAVAVIIVLIGMRGGERLALWQAVRQKLSQFKA
ncbi:MATE family efflux transporter [Mitsuokella jalaludinii]|uniref:Polysaccharide biosynthesis protein n=1 Tax=Mitsuokella jalaludinii TaxID=187979 RepID=A0A173XJF8_9FIRM|nr:hypothetical protein [Mitsuokella jalaludinii]CUN51773.1 Polysaccharide biosynthesis protein [Mitsuokella jalaludinii]